MYPGGSSNHAKAVCSDGAFQASRPYTKALNDVSTKAFEEPPPFPQPDGIFTNGKFFNPAPFLHPIAPSRLHVSDAISSQFYPAQGRRRPMTSGAESGEEGYMGIISRKLQDVVARLVQRDESSTRSGVRICL